jgi:uncharacterized damage-inducible protein DinB
VTEINVPEREDKPKTAPERETLEAFLEFHRTTLLRKCSGLTDDQLRERAVPPSNLSLLGLVRHMAEVERAWFRRTMGGEHAPQIYCSEADPDADFDRVDTASVDEAFATYAAEVEAARDAIAERRLDATGRRQHDDERGTVDFSLRWVFLHMIEEYARHNGHADLLRERIDGSTGE